MIEFIPNAETKSSIKERLRDSLNECISMKAAIAYWTISREYLPELVSALSKPNSFACADIHLPTNIDNLAEFKKHGCDVYLHCYDLAKNIVNEQRLRSLMHVKSIVFEFKHRTEIWVGSHNFTRKALDGINFELSTIIATEPNSAYQKQVEKYLELIRQNCEQYDLSKIGFYKKLQQEYDKDDECFVIEFVGYNIDNLLLDNTIQIISKDKSNFEKYKLINKKIIIHALDLSTKQEYVFDAVIINAGAIDYFNEKSYGMTFSPRRYAIREKDMIPYLQKENTIDQKLLMNSAYFLNIQINKGIADVAVYIKPNKREQCWAYNKTSVHLERLENDDKIELFGDCLEPIKCANEKESVLQEFSLKSIVLNENQKFLVDVYENDKYGIMYKSVSELEASDKFRISNKIKRSSLIIKRIIKNIKGSDDESKGI